MAGKDLFIECTCGKLCQTECSDCNTYYCESCDQWIGKMDYEGHLNSHEFDTDKKIDEDSDGMLCPECKHINPVGIKICKSCDSVVFVSETNSRGERFTLGDAAYFERPATFLCEKGVVMTITRNPETIRVKYCNSDFKADRYDEILSVEQIYSSIESMSQKGRSRSRPQLFKPFITVSSDKRLSADKERKPKLKPPTPFSNRSMDCGSDEAVNAGSEAKDEVNLKIRDKKQRLKTSLEQRINGGIDLEGSLLSRSSSSSSSSSSSHATGGIGSDRSTGNTGNTIFEGTTVTSKRGRVRGGRAEAGRGRPGGGGAAIKAKDQSNVDAGNGSTQAGETDNHCRSTPFNDLGIEELIGLLHLRTDFTIKLTLELPTLSEPMVGILDVSSSPSSPSSFGSRSTSSESSRSGSSSPTSFPPLLVPNESVGASLDAHMQRGLACALLLWANPPRTDAQLEELGAVRARKPPVSVAAVQALVDHWPLSLRSLRALPACADLADLPASPWSPSPSPTPTSTSLTGADPVNESTETARQLQAEAGGGDGMGLASSAKTEMEGDVLGHVAAWGHCGHEVGRAKGSGDGEEAGTSIEEAQMSVGDELVRVVRDYLWRRCRLPLHELSTEQQAAHAQLHSILTSAEEEPPSGSSLDDVVDFDKEWEEEIAKWGKGRAARREGELQLPLTNDEFSKVMDIAFLAFGGRQRIEGSSGIRGQKFIDGMAAMYGGVNGGVVAPLIERSSLGRADQFVDIGSGIGQVCIQVAAMVCCKVRGIEVVRERNETAKALLRMFDRTLAKLGCRGRVGPLVAFEEGDFTESSAVNSSSVIFFNNFGRFFADGIKHRGNKSLTLILCEQIQFCDLKTQIFTLNSLIEASHWLWEAPNFKCPKNAASWTDDPFCVFHYRILAKEWACTNCSFSNELAAEVCMVCGKSHKTKRAKGATFTCM